MLRINALEKLMQEPVPLAPYESSRMDVSGFAPQRAASANYEHFS